MRLNPFFHILSFFTLISSALAAADTLYSDEAFYCLNSTSIQVDGFGLTYHKSNGSLDFQFSLTPIATDLNVDVNLYVTAYGLEVLNQTLNICDLFSGVICPLPNFNFTGEYQVSRMRFPARVYRALMLAVGYGSYPFPDLVNDLPALAWTVPDLEAFARLELRSTDGGELRACVQTTIVNGLSAEQTSVKWAAGMFTLVAVLVGLIHSCINSPSPAQYRWFDIVLLYQTAVALALMPLNYPLVYRAFARNFFWAVGMVSSDSFRTSINDMRYKTGGNLNGTVYPDIQFINADLTDNEGIDINQLIDTIRQLGPLLGSGGLGGLLGRSLPDVPEEDLALLQTFEALHSTPRNPATHLLASRAIPDLVNEIRLLNPNSGIPGYVNSLGIPRANAFTTLFFIMLIVIAIAIALHAVIFVIAWLVERSADRQNWGGRLVDRYWGWCGGNALRLVYPFSLRIGMGSR